MTTRILLIRHGRTPTTGQVLPGRAPGLHLSEVGRGQAREIAKKLSGEDIAAVYSSPLERARETAAPLAAVCRREVLVDERLTECDFGDWTGRRLAELNTLPEWETVQKTPSAFRFPGGESFVEMRDRMAAALSDLARRHAGRTICCFSHADPIKAAVMWAQGRDLDEFQQVSVDTAGVQELSL